MSEQPLKRKLASGTTCRQKVIGHYVLHTTQLQRLAGRLREGKALIPIMNAPKCINSGIPFRINSVLLIGIAFFL